MTSEIETNIFINFAAKEYPSNFATAETGDWSIFGIIFGVFLFAVFALLMLLLFKNYNSNTQGSHTLNNSLYIGKFNLSLQVSSYWKIIFILAFATIMLISSIFVLINSISAFASSRELETSSTITATYDEQTNNLDIDTGWLKAIGDRNLYIKECSVSQTAETKFITNFEASNLKIEVLDGCLYDAQPNGQTYTSSEKLRALIAGVQEDMKFSLSNYPNINIEELNGKNVFSIKFVLDTALVDDPLLVEPETTYNGNEIIAIDDNIPGANISGITKATSVGDYSATITLNDGWIWWDDTSEPKVFEWSIVENQEEIYISGKTEDITYDGEPHFGYVEVPQLPLGYYLKEAKTTIFVTHVIDSAKVYTCDVLTIENAQGQNVTDKLNIKKSENTIQIVKKDLKLTSSTEEKTYDGKSLKGTASAEGLVEGEEITLYTECSITDAGNIENVIKYDFKKPADQRDYEIKVENGTLTVNPANSKITTNDLTVVYDGKEHVSSYSIDGLVNEETLILDLPKLKNAGSVSNDYIINTEKSTANISNYDVEVNIGTLTIEPKEVSIISKSAQQEYNGQVLTLHEVEFKDNKTFIDGEGATYNFTGQQLYTGESDNLFMYELNEGTLAINYSIEVSYGTLSVINREERYEINLEANGATYTYDGTEHTASGFASLDFSFDDRNYKVVDCTSQASGTDWKEGGYETAFGGSEQVLSWEDVDVTDQFCVNYIPNKLIINKREIELTSGTSEKEYDGDALYNHDVTITKGSFADGESFKYSNFSEVTYVTQQAVENSFNYEGDDKTNIDNYQVTQVHYGTLTIKTRTSPYQINLVANGLESKYNGEEQSVTGFETERFIFNNHEYKVFGYSSSAKSTDAITTTTSLSQETDFGVEDENQRDVKDQFNVSYTPADFIIKKRNVTFTSGTSEKVYDSLALSNEEVSISEDGLAESESFNFFGFPDVTNVVQVSNNFEYAPGDNTKLDNYNITSVYGTLKITPKDITDGTTVSWSINENPPKYDTHELNAIDNAGFKLTYKPSSEKTINLEIGTDFNITSGKTGTNANVYNMTVTGIGNYTGTRTDCKWEIAKRSIANVGVEADLSAFNVYFGDDTPGGIIKYDTAPHTPDIASISVSFKANNGEDVTMDLPAGSYLNSTLQQTNANAEGTPYDLVVDANEASNFSGINTDVKWRIEKGVIEKITITGAKASYPYDKDPHTVPADGQNSFTATASIAEGYSSNIFNMSQLNHKPSEYSIIKSDVGVYPLGLNNVSDGWKYNDANVEVKGWEVHDGELIISEQSRFKITVKLVDDEPAGLNSEIFYNVTIVNNYNQICQGASLNSNVLSLDVPLDFQPKEAKTLQYKHKIISNDFDDSDNPIYTGTFTIKSNVAEEQPSFASAKTNLSRTSVDRPASKDSIYDKKVHGYDDNEWYTVTQDAKKTDVKINEDGSVGAYTAIFTLNSYAYQWSDNTRGPINVEWKIQPRELNVTAKNTSITYGEAPKCYGYQVGDKNLCEGDTIESIGGSVSYTYNYSQYGDVGTYEISLSLGENVSKNYNTTCNPGTLTVQQKEILSTEVNWNTTTKVYDTTPYVSNILISKVRQEDEVFASPTYKQGDTTLESAPTNFGSYSMSLYNESLSGNSAKNYIINSEITHELTISKATPSVAWSVVSTTAYNLTRTYSQPIKFDLGDNNIYATTSNTDSDSISYSLVSPPKTVSISSDTITFSASAEPQVYNLTVKATSGSTDNYNEASKETVIKIDLSLQLTVTFDKNGGKIDASPKEIVETYNSNYSLPTTNPTKTGYSFAGWYTLKSGGSQITTSSKVTTQIPINLYAHWTPITYNVSFNANKGSKAPSTIIATYDSDVTLPTAIQTRTGYTFLGWATSSTATSASWTAGETVTKPNWCSTQGTTKTLYAVWKAITYTVKYDANEGGSAPASQTATYDSNVTLSSTTPTRTGYTFLGWATSSTATSASWTAGETVTKPNWCSTQSATKTLYAVWTAITYKVQFDSNGGSGSMSNQTFTYGVSQALTANSYTKTGYTFDGWATSSGGSIVYTDKQSVSNLCTTQDATKTLYAHWKANTYTVTFNKQSGSDGTNSVSATYGSSMPTITKPTRTGYTFGGYFTSTDGGGTQYYTASGTSARTWNKTSATTLYAKWTANNYTVKFNANGGLGTMNDQSFTYGTAQNLKANIFTKTDYTFEGWATSSTGSVAYTDQQSVINLTSTSGGTVTLYAKWKLSGFKAYVNLGEGRLRSGKSAPEGWTKVDGQNNYYKTFPKGTTYDTLLSGWDEVIDETTSNNKSYWGITPYGSTQLTEDTTFSAQYTYLNYQVCIWGVQQDTTQDGTKASLTLGPPTGSDSSCLDVDGGHTKCFHDDSWTDIIKNISSNPTYYSDCIDKGCTKSVPIILNNTIGDSTSITSKELCSVFIVPSYGGHLKVTYCTWNNTYNSSNCESTNWATSRIRATLNGKTGSESSFAGTDCLDSTNCLLSCFPPRLVKAIKIKSKSYKVPTTWTTSGTYPIGNTTTVSDKLWLMSGEEVYGQTGIPSYFKEFEKAQYTKKQNEGTTWNAFSKNKVFTNSGSSVYWWLRSPYRRDQYSAGYVSSTGGCSSNTVKYTWCGISPCFCL